VAVEVPVEECVEDAVDADEVDDIWDGGVLKATNQVSESVLPL
jgi:hypothetical protein